MTLDFKGRVAIVTGSGRGLGRAHALALASRGCRVVVNDMGGAEDSDVAQSVVDEITQNGGEAVAELSDVVTGSKDMVATAINAFGQLDILVNNAGILEGSTFADTPAEIWKKVADVHYYGTVEACRAAWPHLVKSGSGRIVNTSSSGMLGNTGLTSYGSAKGGVFAFSRSLAIEGMPFGVNVNSILPSAWTRITEEIDDPDIQRTLIDHFQPHHVSAFVTWLAHQDTKVTNEAFRISGGSAARIVLAMGPLIRSKDSSAESWAETGDSLLTDQPLTPVLTTSDLFGRELQDATAGLSFEMPLDKGGLSLKTVTSTDKS